MSSRYRLTPEAQANVEEICHFVVRESIDAALRVHGALEEAFRQ